MNLQAISPFGHKSMSISTTDIDDLAQFQVNKNRRYTQLQAGRLHGHYSEVNLGGVQVFREKLTVGVLIEAAPASSFVPFGALLPSKGEYTFCGKNVENNAILQATGGEWDFNFTGGLNYVAAVFHRENFNRDIQQLTGEETPHDWLVSKPSLTEPLTLNRYARALNTVINLVENRPEILSKENAVRMLGDSLLRLLFNVLKVTALSDNKETSRVNRSQGVHRVIDYLHSYAADVPTIPELCLIAKLSERNLQYGFKEYLGVTPIRYLRLVRLNGVRRDLLMSHPKKDKIVDIALNWGFIELGRFAGEYKQLFQELPSTTLNSFRSN